MTDNPNIIKEALEAGRKNTIALCKRLDLTDEQTKECLKPFDDALALIEKSERVLETRFYPPSPSLEATKVQGRVFLKVYVSDWGVIPLEQSE